MHKNNNQKPESTRQALLFQIEAFLRLNPLYLQAIENSDKAKSEWFERNFGWVAIKDFMLVERLRNGGDVTTRKLDAILNFIIKQKGNCNGKKES